ncbi:tripartite ATP-independent transporter DctP family solute receptor [Defluviimonas denitrificans]|jgi:tripartite ATP-independent transporter DctP family solute receptor|uniref:Tripartite ATP-independent transporter DctP family solute receptor n=1 Tax=Albidovulum denitrificans TaxID=404881 RepID=A0A2S8RWC7_9RHOB|nr:TRAP transporter substrate-binding protein DctP [Defluviimonas denitrificans]PQV52855.1 tripartite ATP-independent transporter DctP family solute receptor [Defluviimonas denitrificans]
MLKLKSKLLAASVAVASLFAAGAGAQEYTMKIGHVGALDGDDQQGAAFIKSFLEARSNGRIKVEIYPNGQMGDFRAHIEAVQLGTLELTATTGGGIAAFVPEIQVTDIPYTLRDDLVAEKVSDSPFFDDMRNLVLERTGNVRLLSVSNSGRWRSFFTTKKLIKSVDDLKGVKMRTINSPLQIEFVNALGGNATPIGWGELYTSLQTGVVEGTKNAATDIVPAKLDEVIKYASLDEHAYLFGFWWVNDDWLKSLPEDLQNLVVDAVRQGGIIQTQWNKEQEAGMLQQFVENGGTVYVPTAEERATFYPGGDAAKAWFSKEVSAEWLGKWESAIADVEAEIDAERARTIGR